jgi:hypothetical protein
VNLHATGKLVINKKFMPFCISRLSQHSRRQLHHNFLCSYHHRNVSAKSVTVRISPTPTPPLLLGGIVGEGGAGQLPLHPPPIHPHGEHCSRLSRRAVGLSLGLPRIHFVKNEYIEYCSICSIGTF